MNARALVLTRRPAHGTDVDCFELSERALPAPAEGQVLVRSTEVSVDPSMILRLRTPTYAPAFAINEPVEGRAVGAVIESRCADLPAGSWVVHFGGWQDHAVIDADTAIPIRPALGLPPHLWLHVLGAPGLTAFVGLLDIAQLREGERVWVSAASGAVGSIAAQLAKARGASLVIGSTGGPEKAERLVTELGLDAGLDYRRGDLSGQINEVSPEGIDVYFDNVGGDHLEAALEVLSVGGRIAACGMISRYSDGPSGGASNLAKIISSRLRMEGFLVLDHLHRRRIFEEEMQRLIADDLIRSEVEWFNGLESIPQALLSLISGEKLGKALVAVWPTSNT